MRTVLNPLFRTPRPVHAPLLRRGLSQGGSLVQVNPQVSAPVSISLGLGSLPLSIGLFAASGASFLIGSQVPDVRGITNIIGVLTAAGGVVNLLVGKKKEEAPPPPASSVYAPPGSQATAREIVPSQEEAFAALSGRFVTPENFTTLDVSFIGSAEIPVVLRLNNPTPAPASFDLILEMNEYPVYPPFGTQGDPVSSSKTLQVTVGPGAVLDVPTSMTSVAPSIAEHVEVDLLARKRRIGGGNPQNLASTSFVLE